MADFIELTYKGNGKKFFINVDSLCNFEENKKDGGSFIFMMPHLMLEVEESDAHTAPYVEMVEELVPDILMKLQK